MQSETVYDDEIEINIREIIQSIWARRFFILVLTIGFALVTFAISHWLLPRKFNAIAYISIGQPIMNFANRSDFSISPQVDQNLNVNPSNVDIRQAGTFTLSPSIPDTKTVIGLSTAPGLLNSVLIDQNVVTILGKKNIQVDQLSNMVTSQDIGKDQVSLMITDTDPQRAALLANTLAENIVENINSNYGFGTMTDILDKQAADTYAEYSKAQSALEDELSKNQVDGLKAQLDGQISDLTDTTSKINHNTQIIEDLVSFDQGLKDLSGETPLSLSDGVALTNLRQSALTTTNGNTIDLQIDGNTFAGITVADAMKASGQLRASLVDQNTRLQDKENLIEQKVPKLRSDLENVQSKINQLTIVRDQASKLHESLVAQQQVVSLVLVQSAKVASISIPAVQPTQPSSPKTLIYTIAAGIIGLFLALVIVFLQYWWNSEIEKKPATDKIS